MSANSSTESIYNTNSAFFNGPVDVPLHGKLTLPLNLQFGHSQDNKNFYPTVDPGSDKEKVVMAMRRSVCGIIATANALNILSGGKWNSEEDVKNVIEHFIKFRDPQKNGRIGRALLYAVPNILSGCTIPVGYIPDVHIKESGIIFKNKQVAELGVPIDLIEVIHHRDLKGLVWTMTDGLLWKSYLRCFNEFSFASRYKVSIVKIIDHNQNEKIRIVNKSMEHLFNALRKTNPDSRQILLSTLLENGSPHIVLVAGYKYKKIKFNNYFIPQELFYIIDSKVRDGEDPSSRVKIYTREALVEIINPYKMRYAIIEKYLHNRKS